MVHILAMIKRLLSLSAIKQNAQTQLSENIANYFQSSVDKKGILSFLTSTNGNQHNIYVNHNDYLNLSFDARLVNFNTEELVLKNKQGSDSNMSGLFLPKDALHYQVSDLLAKKILDKECVHLTQSGYIANYSLLQSIIVPSKTHVYIDANAHESLWQGASRGIIHKINHNSIKHLEDNLKEYGSGIIVIDALYSSRGTIADLVKICDLKEKYSCIMVSDESHSIGVYGPHGRGLAAAANVTDRIEFIIGSLAKAFCVRAGFISGRTQDVLFARETSSAAIYSSSLMNWDMQRLRRSIDVVYHADEQRERLLQICQTIRQAALNLGFKVEKPILPSPILSLMGGPYDLTKRLQTIFEMNGIAPSVFIPPATPVNRSIIRISLNAGLSDQDVLKIIDTFKSIAQQRSQFPYTFQSSD